MHEQNSQLIAPSVLPEEDLAVTVTLSSVQLSSGPTSMDTSPPTHLFILDPLQQLWQNCYQQESYQMLRAIHMFLWVP